LTSSLLGMTPWSRLNRRGRQVWYRERMLEPGEWQFRTVSTTHEFRPRYPSLE
jgi:hypothetical protein